MILDNLNSPIASKFKCFFDYLRASFIVDLSYLLLVERLLIIISWFYKDFLSHFPSLYVKGMVTNCWLKDFDLNFNELINSVLNFSQLAVGSYLCFVFP